MSEANSAVTKADVVEEDASMFGKDAGLVHEAIITGRKVRAGKAFWTKLAHEEGFFSQVVLLSTGAFMLARPSFLVAVDYDAEPVDTFPPRTDRHMIDQVNRKVFPAWKKGKCQVQIVLFSSFDQTKGYNVDEHSMQYVMEPEGCRPGKNDELFALLAKYPEIGSKFSNLVAYGSHIAIGGKTAVPLARCMNNGDWTYLHYVAHEVDARVHPLWCVGVKEG